MWSNIRLMIMDDIGLLLMCNKIASVSVVFVCCSDCALEDETYEDGAETQVECNRCVCACGNWVCTAVTCDGEQDSDLRDISLTILLLALRLGFGNILQ